jgi:tricorn protease
VRRLVFPLIVALFCTSVSADPGRLLRFPDIHQEQVTFIYAGDVYIADTQGGEAQRLTSHEGFETFPKFSPDGSLIAFSAEYNGTRQVYVVPSSGGTPRQLTWYNDVGVMPPRGGFDYRVLDWTPDGKHIMVRANRLPWGVRMGQYHLIPAEGGNEVAMEIPQGGGGMFSPDGKQVVYTPVDREFRTWKRYRGGRAQEVWTYDIENHTSQQLTHNRATDHQPLWVGDDIYFVSDRDYTLNLYQYQPDSEPLLLTRHDEFDVLWPSAGPAAIVYENGGKLFRFDPATGKSRILEIELVADRPGLMPRFVAANDFIESSAISPDAKRVAFAARGEIFSVPAKNGRVRNLTNTPAEREIQVSWSPDGRWVSYLSDRTGEYELYVTDQDGSGEPRQVTSNSESWSFQAVWSPDSSKLVFGDTRQQLRVVDAESGKVTDIDHSERNNFTDYSWSPDSRHIAYIKNGNANFGNIWLHSFADGENRQLSSGDTREASPVFDPKGRYLYFVSNRDFNLSFGDRDNTPVYTGSGRVFAGQLSSKSPGLKRPRSDEVSLSDVADEKESGEKKDSPLEVDIEVAGFEHRLVALSTDSGTYSAISANDESVFYRSLSDGSSRLMQFDLESEKENTVLADINGYVLAAKGGHILYNKNDSWGIVEAKADQKMDSGVLKLAGMKLRIEPAVEWQQMYTDQWRIVRDWFYEPNMHGNDWNAIKDKYAPLVAHVAHRADLDYIFGEIAGELNAGHNYVTSGDQANVKRLNGGLLGAEIVASDGFYRIEKIFAGEPWSEPSRSPLAEPGVGAAVGDYILAVDGVSSAGVKNFYQLLENKGSELISLTLNDKPENKNARKVLVKTITSETNLRYLDWVQSRREKVDELSNGRIGYLHLPNTAFAGNRELYRLFPPQIDKDAILIDVRYNGGGFIPDHMVSLLARQPISYWKQRGLMPKVQATPQIAHGGPKAVLINGYSSSGGDAFPHYFKQQGLGPLIGTRTWGGLIGISGNPMLVDGGGILVSRFRLMDTDGRWVVENEGVAPDIEVVDRPEQVARGEDPSLEEGVRYLLQQLDENPPRKIEPEAPPSDFR